MRDDAARVQNRICVLMAVHNGSEYLPQQLASLQNQDNAPYHVIISDDGSRDDSVKVIESFFRSWPECTLTLIQGPMQGSAANFLNMFRLVPDDAEYVALCDQDDVWLAGKLRNAVDSLNAHCLLPIPALYGSATWVCGPDLEKQKKSKQMSVSLGFQHALVENYAGGNTMVLNRPAIDLIKKSLHLKSKVLVHDWWIYQMITGAGGKAIYDPEPSLLYRQHSLNLIGDNGGWKGRFNRVRRVIRGDYKRWTDANLSVLKELSHLLTPSNADCVADIRAQRNGGMVQRSRIVRKHALRRQGAAGQAALWLAVLSKRF